MEIRWRMTYSQQVIVATVGLLIGLISCDVRPGTRALRWLQGDPGAGGDDAALPDSAVESNEAVPPMSSDAVQSTKPLDLIPRVDGLTFLDDDDDDRDESPKVLRFYSARDPSPPTTRHAAAIHSNDDGDGGGDGPALGSLVEGGSGVAVVAASPERVSVQRIVAGVSFVGGLAASLSACLVCCRVRRGSGRLGGLFRTRRADDVRVDGADDVVTNPETTGDVKEAS